MPDSDPNDTDPAGPPEPADAERRTGRRRAVGDLKRRIILDAAERVFAEHGLEGASLRAIARAAGYTQGAIYFHYASKEEIYGDLLGGSLDRLDAAVRAAEGEQRTEGPAAGLHDAALAFYDYYRDHPQELELGFYLFRGMRPLGLTPELDARLNARLRAVLALIEAPIRTLGADPARAERETAALFAQAAGLLLLVHTGRLRLFGLDGRALFRDYLARLVASLSPR